MPKRKIVIIILIALLCVFGLVFVLFGLGSKEPVKDVELEFWGVFDDADVYESFINDFNKEYPRIEIEYHKKISSTYEKDLLEAMASGRGPDIFMLHNTWLPRYEDKIWAAPLELITFKEVQDNFVDVVVNDFIIDNYVCALPLSVDTLALYYNKDIFNTNGIPQPAETWEDFLSDVEKITVKDERGNIIKAGAALGTARNINRSTDILSLLMLQSGAQMVNSEKTKAIFDESVDFDGENFCPGQRAFEFYTDFTNPLKSVYTWNTRMHYSIDAFYEGKTAMMFNYAYHFPTVQTKAPYLNFDVASMPQIKGSIKDINYANYWGLTVSHNCQDSREAWQFIVWLTNKENSQKYLEITKRPTARRDLVFWQKDDPDMGIFAEQALTAYSWYQVDNSSIETVLADMIESVVLGEATIREAIEKAANQVTSLMK
ncbi:MAG: extracellular solute-binding protein [Parcubacteria group bacterium]|nr:extracellular solute-binding protein [Parcubacteria group bacterium]